MRSPSLPRRSSKPKALKALLLEHLLDTPQRLPGAFFIFNQGKTHMLVPVLAKAHTRAHRDLGLGRSFLENSSEPMALYLSGIEAQTNIVALGSGTGQFN